MFKLTDELIDHQSLNGEVFVDDVRTNKLLLYVTTNLRSIISLHTICNKERVSNIFGIPEGLKLVSRHVCHLK